MDYGMLHRGIDAKTLDSEEDRGPEVSQMRIEDQEDQVWFYVILSKCLVLRSFVVLEGPA